MAGAREKTSVRIVRAREMMTGIPLSLALAILQWSGHCGQCLPLCTRTSRSMQRGLVSKGKKGVAMRGGHTYASLPLFCKLTCHV